MIRKHKWKIAAAVIILCVLGYTFWYGGNAPGLRGWTVSMPDTAPGGRTQVMDNASTVPETGVPGVPPDSGDTALEGTPESMPENMPESESMPEITSENTSQNTSEDTSGLIIPAAPEKSTEESPGQSPGASAPSTAAPNTETGRRPAAAPGSDAGRPLTSSEKLALAKSIAAGQSSEGVEKGDAGYSRSQGMDIDRKTGKDRYMTDPVPEGKPVPVEPETAVITDKTLTCTLSVRCDTILDNMSWLDKEKWELVPEDGVIFPVAKVTVYEGESVFNVLRREMKKAGIHMEFVNTPMYNSAYIEGINNLYEFDVGELSGWMYKVNGWFPNYGCSRYQLHDGDTIEWVYTCNLGIDVGGYYAAGGS